MCATRNDLMQLKTILCEFWQIYATRNPLMKLKIILCKFWRVCATKNALKQLETILCDFGRICATGNTLMLLETILCEFGQICATGNPFQWLTVGRNSILNFPAKIRTGMCRALLCGDWWWLITQPRPIWKKASPGLQRPSHTDSQSVWPFLTPIYLTPTLDLTQDLPLYITQLPIRLLVNDTWPVHSNKNIPEFKIWQKGVYLAESILVKSILCSSKKM